MIQGSSSVELRDITAPAVTRLVAQEYPPSPPNSFLFLTLSVSVLLSPRLIHTRHQQYQVVLVLRSCQLPFQTPQLRTYLWSLLQSLLRWFLSQSGARMCQLWK